MTKQLSTQPYKGSRDFYPEDMNLQNFIFNTWKKVCERYGYEQYDGPFIENFDIYAAKSGEELVNEQLYSFTDRGDRKVAIRPEMTPTLARMVAGKFNELPRPIRWYSIANFWRYEKPQKGRGREFYQLNLDIFGVEGVEADLEVVSTMVDILIEFGAKEKMFEVRINNRRLADSVYEKFGFDKNQIKIINKAIDKKSKISDKEFRDWLKDDANLTNEQINSLEEFVEDPMPMVESLKDSQGAKEILDLLELTKKIGIDKFVRYDPSTMRGLDYYTGNVFEVFDLNPENTRSIAGGGRYDDLVTIFKGEKLTGTGYAMGDITLADFLEAWGLSPDVKTKTDYLITLWPSNDPKFLEKSLEVANKLRSEGKNVSTWLEKDTKLDKQLKYANKMGISNVVIIGEKEIKENMITVKNMETGEQETIPFEKLSSNIE
ncbi:MAG: histidine--tRNA ligase [Patescibacteria group bacterium]